jgi:hypothetical protein
VVSEPEGTTTLILKPIIRHDPKAVLSVSGPHSVFIKSILMLFSHFLGLPNALFQEVSHQNSVCIICLPHHVINLFIILNVRDISSVYQAKTCVLLLRLMLHYAYYYSDLMCSFILHSYTFQRKYAECKQDLGFCIPGFQVHSISTGNVIKFGKEHGKKLNKTTIKDGKLYQEYCRVATL